MKNPKLKDVTLLTLIFLGGFLPQAQAGQEYSETAAAERSGGLRVAQDTSAEKSAFESARELGTTEAWNAFLGSYPKGFYADLAKAYIQKLSEKSAAPSSVPSPAPVQAPQALNAQVLPVTTATGGTHEIGCASRGKITSRESSVPAKITFLNRSGMYRAIQWIGFKGEVKNYASLNPGQDVVLDTFVTHPWMITDGPGNCIHIILPADGATQVSLGAAEPYIETEVRSNPERAVPRQQPKAEAKRTSRKITCSAGKTWNGSQCIDNVYVDKKGRPKDGYYSDGAGNIYQDNGGGE